MLEVAWALSVSQGSLSPTPRGVLPLQTDIRPENSHKMTEFFPRDYLKCRCENICMSMSISIYEGKGEENGEAGLNTGAQVANNNEADFFFMAGILVIPHTGFKLIYLTNFQGFVVQKSQH